MSSLLLLNGSPRGPRSNSMKMLTRVAEGWERAGGEAPEILHLSRPQDFARAVEAFAGAEADTVILGMPLYTDAMPALVKEYIEALAPSARCEPKPRLGFLVQSGFSEALHSRPLERYLEKLAARLGCEYVGTIVRGGGEALQAMPDEAAKKLFERLRELGESASRSGRFDAEVLRAVAGTERYSPMMAAVVSVAMKAPVAQFYWNGQLKKNGAWDRRFDAPYADDAGRGGRTHGATSTRPTVSVEG